MYAESVIHSFIHLLNNTTEKKKYSNMYSRAEQQGKCTGSCPEITEQHKDYVQQTKIKIQSKNWQSQNVEEQTVYHGQVRAADELITTKKKRSVKRYGRGSKRKSCWLAVQNVDGRQG